MIFDLKHYIFFLIAYLICSIPFGLVVGKIFGNIDVRKQGSKNIGATNVARLIGKKWGILTFMLDGMKGGTMIIIAKQFSMSYYHSYFLSLVVLFCVLGHIFPIYLKFKGGKGVATTMFCLLFYSKIIGICAMIIWLVTFVFTKTSSLASLVSIFFATAIAIQYTNRESYILMIILCILIFLRHKNNIINLINGTEKKFNKNVKKR
ncbi:MAG: glycerol-3-phosphate acyltransferase PlsY [Rickettsiales bacterium]|jgi:glycerol-3-phosphate acyltransferase PlsY